MVRVEQAPAQRIAGLNWGFLDEPDVKNLKEPMYTHNSEELCLWGLTLGMTLDRVSHMKMPFPLQSSAQPSPDGFIGAEMILAKMLNFPLISGSASSHEAVIECIVVFS